MAILWRIVMTEEIKRMDIKEFREKGFLQEANRQFFHPLGLALEIMIDENGNYTLGGVWDYREEPEGMFFGNDMISEDKIGYVKELRESKFEDRVIKSREYGLAVNTNGIQLKAV